MALYWSALRKVLDASGMRGSAVPTEWFESGWSMHQSLKGWLRRRAHPAESPGLTPNLQDAIRYFYALAGEREPASPLVAAHDALNAYHALDGESQVACLRMLVERLGAGPEAAPDRRETPLRRLIRRLAMVAEGIETLISMRAEVLGRVDAMPELAVLDADLLLAFNYWFSAGLLVLRRLEWSSPARTLEYMIVHEAVHEIKGWDDLRRRVEPADRRCYGLFHPSLPDTPLIFLEIALTAAVPETISEILAPGRERIPSAQIRTATFYSISNCKPGLRGIPFGNMLIKQASAFLAAEFPSIRTFVTLSPMPGFANWLKSARAQDSTRLAHLEPVLKILDEKDWSERDDRRKILQPALQLAAAWYLCEIREVGGGVADPVARFHLGNGARLENICFWADTSVKGRKQSHGMMVNYRYIFDDVADNRSAYHETGQVVLSDRVRQLLRQ